MSINPLEESKITKSESKNKSTLSKGDGKSVQLKSKTLVQLTLFKNNTNNDSCKTSTIGSGKTSTSINNLLSIKPKNRSSKSLRNKIENDTNIFFSREKIPLLPYHNLKEEKYNCKTPSDDLAKQIDYDPNLIKQIDYDPDLIKQIDYDPNLAKRVVDLERDIKIDNKNNYNKNNYKKCDTKQDSIKPNLCINTTLDIENKNTTLNLYNHITRTFNLDNCTRYYSFERQDPTGQLCKKRQRSDLWRKERLKTITGSKLVNLIPMFEWAKFIKVWYETYQETNPIIQELQSLESVCEKEKSEECMAWGTYHEIDALATFIYHLGDKLDLEFSETTLTRIPLSHSLLSIIKNTLKREFNYTWENGKDDEIWSRAFKVSPDLSGRERITNNNFVAEFKCAYGLRMPRVYDGVPYYYYPQAQYHMLTRSDIEYCYFVSWSPKQTRIWRIERDNVFWNYTMPLLAYFHKLGLDGQVPISVMNETICRQVKDYCKEQVETCTLIGDFTSVYSLHREEELNKLQSRFLNN